MCCCIISSPVRLDIQHAMQIDDRTWGSMKAAMAAFSGCVPGTNSTSPRLLLTGTTSYVLTCTAMSVSESTCSVASSPSYLGNTARLLMLLLQPMLPDIRGL